MRERERENIMPQYSHMLVHRIGVGGKGFESPINQIRERERERKTDSKRFIELEKEERMRYHTHQHSHHQHLILRMGWVLSEPIKRSI